MNQVVKQIIKTKYNPTKDIKTPEYFATLPEIWIDLQNPVKWSPWFGEPQGSAFQHTRNFPAIDRFPSKKAYKMVKK